MMTAVSLSIGDIVIELSVRPEFGRIWLEGSFKPFLTSQAGVSQLVVHQERESLGRTDALRFDTNAGWQIYNREGQLVFHTDASEIASDAWLVVTQDYQTGDIYLPDGCSRHGCLPTQLARLLLIGLLSQDRGLMVHASGVRVDNKGLLFSGTDGIGKTTTARLWETYANATVIGDDHIILREHHGRLWMYSTPWHGMECSRDSVPLEQVFILRQGTENQIQAMAPVQAAAQLLKRSFPPLWSAQGMEYTLGFLDRLCDSVPVHDFAFVPDQSAVDAIQCMNDA